MLLAAPRFRTTVASGAVVIALLMVSQPVMSASGDAPWQAERAAVEEVSRARLAWLRQPETWRLHWSRPLTVTVPAVAAGLIAWLDDGALHGVRAGDGLPAWRTVPSGDTLIFPRTAMPLRGRGRPVDLVPASSASCGHLIYGVINAGPLGPQLACLDCSDTAEGRLLWSMSPPGELVGFDGPPAADDHLCVIVGRGGGDRGVLEIIVHDARDGVVVWRRSLSTAVAGDGMDPARGRRQAALAGGLVIVADHAGSVWAFDRDGRPAWRYTYEVPFARGNDRRTDRGTGWPHLAAPVVPGPEGFVVAPQDRGGVLALAGAAHVAQCLWETADGEPLRIVGVADGCAVVEKQGEGKQGRLIVLDAVSGRVVASTPTETMPAGQAVMAGGVVLQPVVQEGAATRQVALAALASATLRRFGSPFPLSVPPAVAAMVGPTEPHAVHLRATPTAVIVAAANQLLSIGPLP